MTHPGPGAPLSDLEEELSDWWHRSRATLRELARAVHPRLDPTTLPLVLLLARRGPLRPSELGEVLHLDRSTVTRQVDAAQRLGLLTRVADPADARARPVALTPQTLQVVQALRTERLERWRASLTEWPPEDVATLARLLGRLRQAGVR